MNVPKNGISLIEHSQFKKFIIIAFLLLIISILSALGTLIMFKSNIKTLNENYLLGLIEYKAKFINDTLSSNFDSLEEAASILSTRKFKDVLFFIKAQNKIRKFKRIGYTDLTGNAITTDNLTYDVSNRKYFKRAINGEKRVYSPFLKDKYDGKWVYAISVPVYDNNKKVKGVLFALNHKSFEYSIPKFIDNGKTFVFNTDPELKKEFNDISDIEYSYISALLAKEIKAKRTGIKVIKWNKKKSYIAYIPLMSKQSYLITITATNDLFENYAKLVNLFFILGTVIIGIILALFYYLFSSLFEIMKKESSLQQLTKNLNRTFSIYELYDVVKKELKESLDIADCWIKIENDGIIGNIETLQNYTTCLNFDLKYNDDILGKLTIAFNKKMGLSNSDTEYMEAFALNVAIALNKSFMFEDALRKKQEEELFKEILSLSKTDMEFEGLTNLITDKIIKYTNYDVCRVADIVDWERNNQKIYTSNTQIIRKKSTSNEKELFSKEFIEFWINKFKNSSSSIFSINNVSEWNEIPKLRDQYNLFNIKSLTCLHVQALGKNLYVFLANYNDTLNPADNDIDFLEKLRNYLLLFIKENSLYNESHYISDVSHELKTPLSIINSYTETMLDMEENKNGVNNKFLNIIYNNVNRMTKIISDILYVSKLDNAMQVRNFKNANLNNIINKAISQCYIEAASKNIQLKFNSENQVDIKGDSSLLEQSFINLLNNSINYSYENSSIDISMEKTDKEAIIKIQDYGKGMSKEVLGNIFKRFYRSDKSRSRKTGGSGLGLAIVDKIIKFHEGYIDVDSVENEGTTFIIHLPM